MKTEVIRGIFENLNKQIFANVSVLSITDIVDEN